METKTFLPAFHGFYGTLLGDKLDDIEGEIEYLSEETNRDLSYDDLNIDYKAGSIELAKKIFNVVTSELERLKVISTAIFEELISPREYNFSNDSINIEVKLNKTNIQNIKKYINDNKEAWAKYLKDRYTSCSGFCSHYSNNPNEWIIDECVAHEHKLGALLDFILEVEDFGQDTIYDRTEFYIGEFITVKELSE